MFILKKMYKTHAFQASEYDNKRALEKRRSAQRWALVGKIDKLKEEIEKNNVENSKSKLEEELNKLEEELSELQPEEDSDSD